MPIDTADRFDHTVADYVRHRPDYPDALVTWLRSVSDVAPPGPVVDVGAGTGISARRWAGHGYRVIGVEPNDRMRAAAQAAGGAEYRSGSSSETGLAQASAGLVIGCQAFHWFDLNATLPEIHRVLRPGGWAMAAWNLRDEAEPQMAGYRDLMLKYSAEYARMAHGPETLADLVARTGGAMFEARHTQRLDRAGLRGRADSASYVRRGIADRASFEAGLDALFDQHTDAGGRDFDFAYVTRAVAWRRPVG